MKSSIQLCSRAFGLAAAAWLFTGCLPEEFLWWSPDGQVAALRTADGLRLISANGKVSPVLLAGAIQSASWLRDGSSLLVSRSFQVTNWSSVEKLVPAEESSEARDFARAIPDLLKAGLTVSGTINSLDDKFLKPLGMAEQRLLEPAWFCALELHREQIAKVIAGFTNAAALHAELDESRTNKFAVHEIVAVPIRDGQPAGEPRTLVRSLYPLADPVASPRYPVVAFRTHEGQLRAITLDGSKSVTIATENVTSAAWTMDGRSLVHSVAGKNEVIAEISSATIVSESGELLKEATQKDTLAIALGVAEGKLRLAVLPDGRVLFASTPISLPTRTISESLGARFFLLDPTRTNAAPTAVPVKEGSLPEDLSAFAVSPDGRFVALVESGTDAVAVFELSTGRATIVSPAHDGWKSRMIPAWRNSQQLTFGALPSADAKRPELMLWQVGAPARVLSNDWPADLAENLLEGPGKNSGK